MPQVFNIPKLLHGRNGIRIRVALIAVAAAMMGLTAALLARRGAAGAMVGFAVPFALIGLYLLLTRKDWLLLMLLGTRTLLDPLLTIAKGSLGGMGPGAAVNAALLAAGSLLLLRDPHRMLRAPAFLWLPFLGIAGVALALAPDRVMAVRTYMVLLTYFVAFVIPFAVIKQRRDIKHWIWLILAASIVPTIGGFYGIATGGVQTVAAEMEEALELGELELEDPDQFRIQSVFPHPNIYAFFQVTVITTMLYALQARLLPQGRRWQAAGWLYLGVQLVMLLATQTRGAWAACGVIMLVYGLLVDRRMLIYMALACASLLLVPSVQDRLMDLKQRGVDAVGPLNSFAWRQVL